MDALIRKQTQIYENMTKFMRNYTKDSPSRKTKAYLNTRIENLTAYWTKFQENHDKLDLSNVSQDNPYVKEELYSIVEEFFISSVSDIREYLSESYPDNTKPAISRNSSVEQTLEVNSEIKLPMIQLPIFSGNYEDWSSFSDLYNSVIHSNASLSAVQKFYYLKTHLSGNALQLIKNFNVTDSNYPTAWKLLVDRFENKRILVDSELKTLFSLPKINVDSAQNIRNLIDTAQSCLLSLKNLNIDISSWDPMLVYLLVQRLSNETLQLWEQSLKSKTEVPTFEELKQFLETLFRALESMSNSSQFSRSTKLVQNKVHHANKTNLVCLFCDKDHKIFRCLKFAKLSDSKKLDFITNKSLCMNCFSSQHSVRQCPSKFNCVQCKKRHHSLLHQSVQQNLKESTETSLALSYSELKDHEPTSVNLQANNPTSSSSAAQNHRGGKIILLCTAYVKLSNPNYPDVKVVSRALIDQGSQTTFVSENLMQKLRLKAESVTAGISGIGDEKTKYCNKQVEVKMKPLSGDDELNVNALVLKKLTNYSQNFVLPVNDWDHIRGLQLADPNFYKPGKIEIILGSDIYPQIILDGMIKGKINTPIAQNTIFGWILSGPVLSERGGKELKLTNLHCNYDLQNEIKKFWEIEEVPQISKFTDEDQRCEQIFCDTHFRENGRYVVNLPFKDEQSTQLGESKTIATRQFLSLERRLMANDNLKEQYSSCINEYLDLGHMIEITPNERNIKHDELGYQGYYLPHHSVFKETSSTTRLRVVFNASQKTDTGISLNNILLTGPNLQENILNIILRWRLAKIAYTSDIRQMYRQIKVIPNHQNYQRIIWRPDTSNEIKEYKLTTVTFGMDCSAYLAIRVLKQLAEDEALNFPQGSLAVKNDLFVDNLMSGADNVEGALAKQNETIKTLKNGGFLLRKWASNHLACLKDIPLEDRETGVKDLNNEFIQTLGLNWKTEDDTLGYNFEIKQSESPITKRNILSEISRIYDPLGWIAPVVILGKIFMQELWLSSLDWDTDLSPTLITKWKQIENCFREIHKVRIPRWLGFYHETEFEIHGFSDASIKAYSAVIYLKLLSNPQSKILVSKTKVAPIKQLSLPRLELCGALLLSKLIMQTLSGLKLSPSRIYAWVDSKIVLCWISKHPTSWKTFVANRVSQIQNLSGITWRYVPSKDNPADIATRRCSPSDLLKERIWWSGPEWLILPLDHWPEQLRSENTDLEERKVTLTSITSNKDNFQLLNRYSSLEKLTRVTAYILRFLRNCKTPTERDLNHLSSKELDKALEALINLDQGNNFKSEIDNLQNSKALSTKSKILNLNPFLDGKGILRVGGRLEHSKLSYDEKYPIVLSSNSKLSELIIHSAHIANLHSGLQLTLNFVRRRYWILKARNTVKRIIHDCMICARYKAKSSAQLMGSLPSLRVNMTRPFLHSGVDYIGPIEIKLNKRRNSPLYKGYIALFICLSVKAIHLELVTDLTAEAFLAAFRRFTSRRGLCSDLYSDNATNFKSAATICERNFLKIIRQNDKEIAALLTKDKITFHFIPPSSPHFGGLWEAGVKSTKFHLRRILKDAKLTYEEMNTLIIQVERVLNSRPLTELSSDPNDMTPLTPGHFLIGDTMNSIPEPNILDTNFSYLNRWNRVQHLYQHFWKRWCSEYLSRLQQRPKWRTSTPNLTVGELVLLKDQNLPPAKWLLGRIVEVVPGADGKVRVAKVKTKTSTLTRPVVKLCKLH